jgi:hypothetical protein
MTTLYLGNAYQHYCAESPPERGEVLREYARAFLAMSQGTMPADRFDQARPRLMPRVHSRIYYAPCLPPGGPRRGHVRFWHRPLGGHLAVGLAYDLPHGIADLSETHLAGWGVGGDEALAVACDNLRRRSTRPFESPAPGVFVSPWDDHYGASRLALTDLVRDLEVKGSYVALAPDRDTLIVTGSDDPAGLRAMLRLAEEAFQNPYRVSGFAVRLREGRWEPFEPDALYPNLAGFRTLRLQSLAAAYEGQKRSLVSGREGGDDGEFIASCSLVSKSPSEPPTSYAVWTEGITTLLPRTDKVAFSQVDPAQGQRIAAFADWGRVRDVVGDLMTPLDLYPQRFRVDGFPTGEQLRALGFASGLEGLAQ